MVIKNGKLLNDDFVFVDADLSVVGEKIEKIGKLCCPADIDADGCFVVPGFIDTHMHGAMGKNFLDFDAETYSTICSFEAKGGTTSLVPAIAAAPREKLLACVEYMKDCTERTEPECAKIYGLHLEGPFFSEKYKGAHLPENIRDTDPEEFAEYVAAAGGCLKIITLAPELPNADAVIRAAVEAGICVSIGHSAATFEQVCHAVELGAAQGTHLFNAMSPLGHRALGTVGGILFSSARAEMICDFFHLDRRIVKMVYRLKGADSINMITDSEVGTGLPDGTYTVNGRTLSVRDRKTYTEDGTVAGGTSRLIDGVRNVVSEGIPLEDACKMASRNPARTVGIYDKTGSLTEGKTADIVILDRELNLKHVILRGKLLY